MTLVTVKYAKPCRSQNVCTSTNAETFENRVDEFDTSYIGLHLMFAVITMMVILSVICLLSRHHNGRRAQSCV